MKITAQDFHTLYAPSECDLRIHLQAKGEPEAEPGAFEQVLMRLGQRYEATHLATFRKIVELRHGGLEERAERTVAAVADNVAVLYQPVLICSSEVEGVACEYVGAPDFLIREGNSYVVRDVKMVRRVTENDHPEVILQLQFYGWLYEQVFNKPTTRLEVFNGQGALVTVPNNDDNVARHLRDILRLKRLKAMPYEPVGWSKCIGCGFHDRCWTEAKKASDVALVFGVDQNLAAALHKQGIQTIEQLVSEFDEAALAEFKRPWGERMQKVGKSSGAILRSANALLTKRETVLARPAIPKHDHYVMFDLEGIPPQFEKLGKIYLWGMQVFGKTQGEFMPAVAGFGEEGDRDGWNEFLDKADTIFRQHGDIPFVHWSSSR